MKRQYYYGYNIVGAGFLTQAVAIGALFTYGVFFKEFQAEFGWSRAVISGASSLAFLVMGIGGVIAGSLNDRIGPRIILTVSGISLGIGYMLLARMSAPWELFVLYGLLVGVGFSTHDVITLSTIARWFVARRGAMSGLVKVGTGGGQFLMPLVAASLITAVGWRTAYLLLGAFSLAALVAVAQPMRRDPQAMGLLPENGFVSNPAASSLQSDGLTLGEAARTRAFWILCVLEFAIFFCLLTTIVHIVPHARDQGLSPPLAAAVLSTIGGVSMLGRITMGMVMDRIGGKRSLVLCFGLLIASFLWLHVTEGAWMFFVFAVAYGFAHGGFFTVMSPTVAEFFGTTSHGTLFGTVLFCGTLGGSIGPFLAGYVFDEAGSYEAAFMTLTALALAGSVLTLFLKPQPLLQQAQSRLTPPGDSWTQQPKPLRPRGSRRRSGRS